MSDLDDIAGLVLAGGLSRRFGGNPKAFALLAGKPLIAHALQALAPLEHRAINANHNEAEFATFGAPIVPDIIADAGPLGGIHAGLAWASSLSGIKWLATVPVDTPFLPVDFIRRLAAARDAEAVVAATRTDQSPVCALWDLQQLPDIDFALKRGVRKMTDYLKLVSWRTVVLAADVYDPLFNVNTTENLNLAERLLRGT
ncbi:MAG: molybdenum cofactor guanylyltransferase [Alphaproteobacteria bacterium]